jgi:hypothetical protein
MRDFTDRRSALLRMPPPDQRSFLELMTNLKNRWLEVLAAAAAAVDSAARAGLIRAEESRVQHGRVAIERTWLETVDWCALMQSQKTIAVLETSAVAPRLDVARRAA